MQLPAEKPLNLDEYRRLVALEKARCATLARDLFMLSMLFLVASGGAVYYEMPVVAAGLFVVFLIVQQVASETRLEMAMIDANRLLAQMVHQLSGEVAQLRVDFQQEQYDRTR